MTLHRKWWHLQWRCRTLELKRDAEILSHTNGELNVIPVSWHHLFTDMLSTVQLKKVGACAHKVTVPNSWIYLYFRVVNYIVSKPFQLGWPDLTYENHQKIQWGFDWSLDLWDFAQPHLFGILELQLWHPHQLFCILFTHEIQKLDAKNVFHPRPVRYGDMAPWPAMA